MGQGLYLTGEAMRRTPLTQMLLDNLECFTPEQIEKVSTIEPTHKNSYRRKCGFGKILDMSDFQTSGIELFKTRNSPPAV
jgi:hypothetical protein